MADRNNSNLLMRYSIGQSQAITADLVHESDTFSDWETSAFSIISAHIPQSEKIEFLISQGQSFEHSLLSKRHRRNNISLNPHKFINDELCRFGDYSGMRHVDEFLGYINPLQVISTFSRVLIALPGLAIDGKDKLRALLYGSLRQGLLSCYRSSRRMSWNDVDWSILYGGVSTVTEGMTINGKGQVLLSELEALTIGIDTPRALDLRKQSNEYLTNAKNIRDVRRRRRDCNHCSCYGYTRLCCHCDKGYNSQ